MKAHSSAAILPTLLWAAIGCGAGIVNGLLGAAGGILLVAAMPRLPRIPWLSDGPDLRTADRRDVLATALAVMLPVSVLSALQYWRGGIRPDSRLLFTMLPPVAIGGFVGAILLERTSQRGLRLLFTAVVLLAGIKMLLGN